MHKKRSRAYFPELLLNTLLFTILCAVILKILANAHLLKEKTSLLSHAVESCQTAAEFYRNGDGTLDDVASQYPNGIQMNQQLLVYLSEDFKFCNREASTYYLLLEEQGPETISISFYKVGEDVIYSIDNCVYPNKQSDSEVEK